MKCGSRSRTEGHLLKGVTAPVGEVDSAASVDYSVREPPEGDLQFAEIAGAYCGIFPIIYFDAPVHTNPHRLQRFGEATKGAETKRSRIEKPGLNLVAQIWGEVAPGLLEEGCHCRRVHTNGTEFS